MTYQIDQDETNVRWRVIARSLEGWPGPNARDSGCTGTVSYDRYEWARAAAMRDARELGLKEVWLRTHGHEPEFVAVD